MSQNAEQISNELEEFVEIRAMCDEMMGNLYQLRALLEPINDPEFFNRLNDEVIRHYFYAFDSIIGHALRANDEILELIEQRQVI